jgi:hypothetical protein
MQSLSQRASVAAVALLLIAGSSASAAQSSGAKRLYVSNSQSVAIFTIDNENPGSPLATIYPSEAEGLAVDGSRLFVARQEHGDVAVYDTNSLKQTDLLRDPGQQPNSIAFGPEGRVYVGNFASTRNGAGSVSVYERGDKLPSHVLSCSRISNVTGVAVNAKGDVFVSQNGASMGTGEVDVFMRGSRPCRALPLSEYYAGGVAIDPATGDLLAADNGYRRIEVLPPPYNSISHTISLPECIGENVWDMALDPATSLLYISDPGNGADALDYPSGNRVATYSMSVASGIAIGR